MEIKYKVQSLSLSLSLFFSLISCGMRDLSLQAGMEPMPPAMDAWSLNHWTAREVPTVQFLKALPYMSLALPPDQLSQGQHLSFCPNLILIFRDEPMHVTCTQVSWQKGQDFISVLFLSQMGR